MSTTNAAVLGFLVAIAGVRSRFREQHIFVERLPAFESIETRVEPFLMRDTPDASYAVDGVTLNVAINADLKSPRDPNRRSLEASVLIRFASGQWVVDGEIGWSGRDSGSEVLDESQLVVGSVEQLGEQLPVFVDTILKLYREAVEAYLTDEVQ